jgi:hypothetical protein
MGSASAEFNPPTLDWQRVNLEDKLQEKISHALNVSIPDQKSVVSVSIELSEDAKKSGKLSGSKDNPNGATTDKDRVYLGKLELDSPIVEDVPDLFQFIKQVHVSVILDTTFPEGKKTLVSKVVQGAVGKLGPAAADVKIEKVELVTPPTPPTPKPEKVKEPEKPWDAKHWATEFKLPIGFVAATLIVCVFLLLAVIMAIGGYKGLESRKIALMEAQDKRLEAEAAAAAEARAAASEAASSGFGGSKEEAHGDSHSASASEMEGVTKGFDRFRSILKDSPEKAAALVREWIKAPAKGSTEALNALPQFISNEELFQVFKFLNETDRKTWKRNLKSSLSQEEAQIAESFIASQVIEALLVPSQAIDKEVREALSDLSLAECVDLATKDPELGAVLMNLLPTNQVARTFSLLPTEIANSITAASLKLSTDEIAARSTKLKAAVLELKGAKPAAMPFSDRAAELLKEVGPEKEQAIFSALAESQEFVLLESTARRYFPSELVFKLPVGLMKSCLDRLPTARRAEFIASREGEEREALLNAVGRPGSKVRDMIDLELGEVANDETRKRRVEKQKSKLLSQFVDIVRGIVSASESAAELADPILSAWLSEKSGGQIGSENTSAAA